MGVEGTCRSANGGGVPFLYALYIPNRRPLSSSLPAPSWQIFRQSGQIFGKNGQKLDFICSLWCFLGKIGDQKGQKPNIFLKCGCKVGAGCGSVCLTFGVSTGCRLASVRGLSSLSWCVPSLLSTLLLCLWWVACKYAFISHSKGVFKGFYGVRVTLVLCVDCVAFVCVRCLAVLGLVACLPSFCPFSFFFAGFCPFACPFLSLLLLSSGCPLSLPCLSLWVVVSFSLSVALHPPKG